jgi:hypothetical protein
MDVPFEEKKISFSKWLRYLSIARFSCALCSSYPVNLATSRADRCIQFSEPQLEQIRWPQEETVKIRLVSQSAQKTIRFSKDLLA